VHNRTFAVSKADRPDPESPDNRLKGSVGMAVAMLIACWIYNEWSYDRQFANYDRIAQSLRTE
jgi:hypothetical protein